MTFNPKADVSGNRARRGGRTAAVAGGGVVGVGAIVALLFALFSGGDVDLSGLLGGGSDGGSQQPAATPAACLTGADANADDSCRLAAATLSLDDFWAAQVEGYTGPELNVIAGPTGTPCGTADNSVGPFYCPSDQGIYIDPAFFDLMREQFGASAGDLAQLYILGHEWGHHIQHITGVMHEHPSDGTGEDSNGVKTELQADCYAGAWIRDMTEQTDANGEAYFLQPTKAQLQDALNAASAVGDDAIQRGAGMRVNPESWTHGSSADRMASFETGLDGGVRACVFGGTV